MSNLPSKFLERIQILYPDDYTKIVESFHAKKSISIRTNTLKTTSNELKEQLQKSGIIFTEVEWYIDALVIKNKTARELTALPLYKEGLFYIQNLSSMIPALWLNPQPGEKVLDLAAAPGSKTTQMAMMMENKGEIIANDISRSRVFKLKRNIMEQGVINVRVENINGAGIWKKYREYFNKVLLDAPCSAEGRFDKYDPETYKYWSPKKIKVFSKLQKWLLRSAVSSTEIGGIIVYSTCTFAPEENEKVIEWILEKEKENIEVMETKRILPDEIMEGFYIAKLRKLHSNV